MEESVQQRIVMKDVQAEVGQAMLRFMYEGSSTETSIGLMFSRDELSLTPPHPGDLSDGGVFFAWRGKNETDLNAAISYPIPIYPAVQISMMVKVTGH